MKANITIDNFRNLYFQMPKGQRSIRRLHKDLKEKFKNKKTLPSLATIFRYSKKENWIEQSTIVDSRANEKAMELIENWTSKEEAKAKIIEMLGNKEKIMGFGHAVYSIRDPRNAVIKEYAKELSELAENDTLYKVAEEVEKVMADEKKMFANADFFHAPAYFYMGIPTKLFTPIFVMSRVSGWTAHCMEQRANNRIIRPSADYIGVETSDWVDISDRS